MMNTRPIRFFHRGQVVEVADAAPTRSVLEWLREDARCTGTKEGCAEGDCGACTVVLGRLDAQTQLQLEPVNACIQFLPTLDGLALFTVEDLAALGDGGDEGATAGCQALHPVQQAMVDHHGSQCGFCTPGFVMSLWACYEAHQANSSRPTRQQIADDLSGNLCRCTGYRPILDAGERMFDAPARLLNRAQVTQALRTLRDDAPLVYAAAANAATPASAPADTLWAPTSVAEFAALREAHPDARVLAGSTDMGLWVTKQFRPLPQLISIGRVAELQTVEQRGDELHIGAAASLEDAWRALVQRWPNLRDVWLRFASLPIRRAGTMGGNVANGSPIGDSAPVLMALGASLILQRGSTQRRMPLANFYLDYMKSALAKGEFVHSIVVPTAEIGWTMRAYKISKRFDCDISALCAAFALRLEGDGAEQRVAQARLVYGGMAATVRHATRAEAALTGQPFTEATVRNAMAALAQDFSPLTDMRASARYRAEVAANLLLRLWHEVRADAPLPEAATTVWHRAEEVTP